ncbi:MAG TPA: HPr family phosphocarrier protein [Candidatus Dorea gallistercoris]|uniref:HPr family phosphocarrier protein n=1 Tax=Candidatus Dorea gallistercoris TaxID=2838542 RepID=A0A9D1R7Y4_9FIRM|nr:HPr family phosphocarrier protein [Candidatus Dorea gallistercoris]
MKTIKYTIQDELGIHARPAGVLVKEVKKFQSKITLEGNGKTAEAGKLLAVMGMGIKHGTEITITAEGPDEDEAIAAMETFFKENL